MDGLDADFCRAVAAAVLGDAEKVAFVALRSSTRFPALQARTIDLLVRNTSWTLTREATLKVQFPAVLFYDGQGLMVGQKRRRSVSALNGATVCVEKGTTHLQPLVITWRPRYGCSTGRGRLRDRPCAPLFCRPLPRLQLGRVTALVARGFGRRVGRLGAPPIAETYFQGTPGPGGTAGDEDWVTLVRWVLFTLVAAEEFGVTRDNVDAGTKVNDDPRWRRLRDPDRDLAKALGIRGDWAVRAIKAVGNYGEMFERNLGRGSRLNIERGLNRLWTEGGLMYAPPVR